jgi:hypothetical protein
MQISNFIRFNVIYHLKYPLINAFMEQVSIKKLMHRNGSLENKLCFRSYQ